MTFSLLNLLIDIAPNIIVFGLLAYGGLKFWIWYKKYKDKILKKRKEKAKPKGSKVVTDAISIGEVINEDL